MVKVYGASDDLVEIDGSSYKEDEIGCYDSDVRITFVDGTVIRVHYGKSGKGIWEISVELSGDAGYYLAVCDDEDAEIHSDVFEIDSEIMTHSLIDTE